MQLLKLIIVIIIVFNVSCNEDVRKDNPANHLVSTETKDKSNNCINYNFFLSKDLDSARILLDKKRNKLIYISNKQIEVDELDLIKIASNNISYKAYYIMGQNEIIDSVFFKVFDKEIIQEYNGEIYKGYNWVYDTCLDSPELFLMNGDW